ncbi:MAG TPA: Crp/Fnr family transcriptional regulator, partial [Pseudorhizobium sp.]|nr:Crp/Fnr family transcriptional regulator [Pseudorhizobium sp.]
MSPLIRKLENLFPLTEPERRVLEHACSQTVAFRADQDIVLDGDRPGHCNVLLEGMVCRYKILRSGKRQILSFQFPGDIFDAQSFVLEVMDHAICTLTPCRVALIPHATMKDITECYPRIARAIWKDTLVDAAVFREWMVSIGRRPAYERIAHLMCEIYVRLDIVGLAKDGAIGWPITQAEIGDALGLSNVHVNRSLMELRSQGLITLSKKELVIHDWEGLKRAGDFDSNYLHLRHRSDSALRSGNGEAAY